MPWHIYCNSFWSSDLSRFWRSTVLCRLKRALWYSKYRAYSNYCDHCHYNDRHGFNYYRAQKRCPNFKQPQYVTCSTFVSFVLLVGTTVKMLDFTIESIGSYLQNFFQISTNRGEFSDSASFLRVEYVLLRLVDLHGVHLLGHSSLEFQKEERSENLFSMFYLLHQSLALFGLASLVEMPLIYS